MTPHGDCCYPVPLSEEEKNSWSTINSSFAAKVTNQVQQNKNTETISTDISIILILFPLSSFSLFSHHRIYQNRLQEKPPRPLDLGKHPKARAGFVCPLEDLYVLSPN